MPFAIRKHTRKHCYTVYNSNTRRIHAKCTSKARAEKQLKLLRAVVFGNFKPTRNATDSTPVAKFVARSRVARATRKNKRTARARK